MYKGIYSYSMLQYVHIHNIYETTFSKTKTKTKTKTKMGSVRVLHILLCLVLQIFFFASDFLNREEKEITLDMAMTKNLNAQSLILNFQGVRYLPYKATSKRSKNSLVNK